MFFDGSSTSYLFNGKLISNDKEASLKIMPVEQLHNLFSLDISSSDLMEDKLNKTIPSNKIKFNGNTPLSLKNISSNVSDITVAVESNDTGLYHGVLNIKDKNSKTFIPIIVSIKPNFIKLLVWIIDGIVVSIGTWSILNYIFLKKALCK
jgi:hypothetical protein